MPEKFIRRRVNGQRHVPSVRNCSEVSCRNKVDRSEPSAVKVSLHLGSNCSPFMFAIIMDSLKRSIYMMVANDVLLCAREEHVIGVWLG